MSRSVRKSVGMLRRKSAAPSPNVAENRQCGSVFAAAVRFTDWTLPREPGVLVNPERPCMGQCPGDYWRLKVTGTYYCTHVFRSFLKGSLCLRIYLILSCHFITWN